MVFFCLGMQINPITEKKIRCNKIFRSLDTQLVMIKSKLRNMENKVNVHDQVLTQTDLDNLKKMKKKLKDIENDI